MLGTSSAFAFVIGCGRDVNHTARDAAINRYAGSSVLPIGSAGVAPHDAAVPQTVHSRAALRACEIAGGVEALSKRLKISTGLVRAWVGGTIVPPPAYFLKVADIINEADPYTPQRKGPDA